jgi:DNA-binding response OmpR family regulator
MRILLVEDEVRLAENIALALRTSAGFAVDIAEDGKTALDLASNLCYDLVILDLMLPRVNGAEVLKILRLRKDLTPVLILTAKAQISSVISLLNGGADDYLAKPFDLGELLARVKALIRRGKGLAHPTLKIGDLVMNSLEQTVMRAGNDIPLSATEYRILELLMQRPRVILSKQDILEHLYDYNWQHHSNVIEAHMSNLRKKLDANADSPSIETLRGRGYRLWTVSGGNG